MHAGPPVAGSGTSGVPLTKILFKGTFAQIGVKNLRWTNCASVTAKTSAQRAQLLRQTEQAFAAL